MESSNLTSSPDRLIKLAVVGCGEVTHAKHLPAIFAARGVEVVAVVDLDENRCRVVADQFGIPKRCRTIEEVLQLPDLDAVGVCTPPESHAQIAIAALRAGKHVWIDKPMALSEADCRQIIDEAARAGTVTMTAFHMRFHRLVLQARAAIRRGDLGRVESIRVVWHSPRSDVDIPDWKTRRTTGGGALVEIAVHHFDLLRFLLDTEIDEIFAFSRDGVRDDESAVVSARMSDGVVVSGEFSERTAHEIEIVISGTAGLLRLDCLRFEGFGLRSIRQLPGAPSFRLREMWHFLTSLPGGLNIMRQGGDYRISYRNAWRAFFDGIRAGHAATATLDDGLRATQAVCAALRSREEKIAVPVPPINRPNLPAESTHGPPTFSVVVPTFNRADRVAEFLRAMSAQRFPVSRFEIVLVDDGGTQPLEPVIAPFTNSLQIRLLRQANGGCASARQYGIEAARGAFLAFTDDDCRPGPDWLSTLHSTLQRNPNCAVAGPTINGLQRDLRAETTQLIVNWLTHADADEPGVIHFAPTSNLTFPAAQLHDVGGLDRTWRIAGGEDRDLCARWQEAGFRLYFESQAQVLHYHPLTLRQFLRQHFNYGRGARRFRRVATRPPRSRFRSYLRLKNYWRLLLKPFQNYPAIVAIRIAVLLLLTQFTSASGMLIDALSWKRKSPESVCFAPAQEAAK